MRNYYFIFNQASCIPCSMPVILNIFCLKTPILLKVTEDPKSLPQKILEGPRIHSTFSCQNNVITLRCLWKTPLYVMRGLRVKMANRYPSITKIVWLRKLLKGSWDPQGSLDHTLRTTAQYCAYRKYTLFIAAFCFFLLIWLLI